MDIYKKVEPMWKGELVSIFISSTSGEELLEKSAVKAVPGRGIEGDRFFLHTELDVEKHDPSKEVTLIEIESLEALKRDYSIDIGIGDSRRNLVTRGVPLNHLVDQEFCVGEVVLRGIRLCEPCAHLAKMTQKNVRPALVHRGGLRAQIISGGPMKVGDLIEIHTY
jgi:MOSC domain-containing protein YiiM